MIEVEPAAFEQMVADALDGLPEQIGRELRNVVVRVDDGEDPTLLGLYEGVPLTERLSGFSAALPDVITIYRRAILGVCSSEAEVVEQVRRTVVHEVGHHVGIDDDRLHELGY